MAALALVSVTAAVYMQTREFEFLSYDDEGYTVSCPFVKGGLSAANVAASFRDPAWGGIWMPVTYASYMATISLFGQAPGPQHVVSAVFHCIDAVLLLLFLASLRSACLPRREDRTPHPGSAIAVFAAAALWAWHPLRAESVAWVASRKDVLFTFFTLVGLMAHLRALASSGRSRIGLMAVSWAMMALGCMSKPTAMVYPALAFLLEYMLSGPALLSAPRRWAKYLPFLALSAAVAALAAYSQTHATGEAAHPLFYSTFAWRMLNAAVSLGLYVFRTVVPANLQFWYRPVRGGVPLDAATGLSALVVATVAVVFAFLRLRARERREAAAAASGVPRSRVVAVSVLWFLAAISPTLGVAGSFGNHALADRFTYVPAMAFSIAVALCLRSSRRLHSALLSAVAAVFAMLAFRYVATYRNNMTAFENVAAHDPLHCYAWTNIGSETILRTGDLDRGIAFFRKSLAVFPTDEAREELAFALASRNDPKDEAEIVSLCLEGISAEEGGHIPVIPEDKDPNGFLSEALGVIATRHGDWDNAIICFGTAIARDPGREDCRMRLAMSLWNAKRRDEARPHLEALSRSERADISAKARELLSMLPAAQMRL